MSCEGLCSGHYVTVYVDVRDCEALSKVPKPPSVVLKELFSANNGEIEETLIDDIAKQVLLPSNECKIWLSHLQTVLENRRRGAKKAAVTRLAKASAVTTPIGGEKPSSRCTQSSTSQVALNFIVYMIVYVYTYMYILSCLSSASKLDVAGKNCFECWSLHTLCFLSFI